MSVGERIKNEREQRGMTQKQLGEKLGVSQQQIGNWENSNKLPTLRTLQRVAKALDIKLNTLVDEQSGEVEEVGDDISWDVVAENIMKWRIIKDISEECLAEKVHMPWQCISHIERTCPKLSHKELETFAEALGVSVPELIATDPVVRQSINTLYIVRKHMAKYKMMESMCGTMIPKAEASVFKTAFDALESVLDESLGKGVRL